MNVGKNGKNDHIWLSEVDLFSQGEFILHSPLYLNWKYHLWFGILSTERKVNYFKLWQHYLNVTLGISLEWYMLEILWLV